MSLYETLDRLIDAVYENVDLDHVSAKGLRKPLADAIRALRRIDRGMLHVASPGTTFSRTVVHRAEVAPNDWRILLSCGHTFSIKSNDRHSWIPHVGKAAKCFACKELGRT